MPKKEAFASILRKSLQREALNTKGGIALDIGSIACQAILQEIGSIDAVSITSALGDPATQSRPPQYPLTVNDGRYRAAKREIVRRIRVRGTYRPGMSEARYRARRRKGLPLHFRSCEFIAVCEVYLHSGRFQWELGFMELSYCEDGWYEPITKRISCRPFIRFDKNGKQIYDFKLYFQNP